MNTENNKDSIEMSDGGSAVGTSRRGFLRKAGVASGAAAAIAAVPGVSEASRGGRGGGYSSSSAAARRLLARRTRFAAALSQTSRRERQSLANTDEDRLDGFIASFTKTLPHNNFGEVDESAYRKLLRALGTNRTSVWEAVPVVGPAKLANPEASVALSLVGGDSHSFFMPAAPKFSSAEEASEMGEVYAHALLRDLPFDQYGTAVQAQIAAEEMSKFSNFTGPKMGGQVTPETLFRGSFVGDLAGPYVSQFLMMDVPKGAGTFVQRYNTTVPGDNHMLTRADWLNILRGGAPATSNQFVSSPRYLETARDLGEFVHRDYTYQTYLQAALILLGSGAPLNPNNPYNSSRTRGGFVTFGPAEILSLVAEACLLGLKATWYQKWQVHRRLRPEVFGGRVHFVRQGQRNYPINSELLNSRIVEEVERHFGGNAFLPMAYPEGSPTHPAYPAGHAVIAGACTTTLKALFDINAVIDNPVQVKAGTNASQLEAYAGDELTVEGELNKLANNIAIGRNLAGVHWRTDGTEGILLGEKVAVRMLQDYKRTYREEFSSYSFRGFRGNRITI